MKNPTRIRPIASLAATLLLVAGCVTTPKDSGPKYTFYPPAPDAPHLQYLTSYGSEKDLRGTGRDNFVAFITGQAPTYTPILKPYGGAITTNCLYVCDTVGVILRLELNTHKMSVIAPEGPAAFKLPINLALDENGWFYVADAGREEVVILDANKNLVGTIGGKGVMEPRDVVLTKDRIYVGDRLNHSVHVFDKATRTNLFDIPRGDEATGTNSRLYQPINLALDDLGNLYVGDIGGYHVQVFDPDGKYVRTVGRYGDNFGEFARLKGIAVDRERRLYTVDAAGQLAQVFDENGRLLMWFGEPKGSKYPLALPAKVLVDYDNIEHFRKFIAPDFSVEYLVIVINQYGPRKVSVFGFGHKK
ncbi:MAG TPA: 6-bladed beta-propeller [Desulfuromonadaceae bacterium]|nr:6-bladed beta-propeller [Desulfuromonadaceae bacterium]